MAVPLRTRGGVIRVLVADSNLTQSHLLGYALRRQSGFIVTFRQPGGFVRGLLKCFRPSCSGYSFAPSVRYSFLLNSPKKLPLTCKNEKLFRHLLPYFLPAVRRRDPRNSQRRFAKNGRLEIASENPSPLQQRSRVVQSGQRVRDFARKLQTALCGERGGRLPVSQWLPVAIGRR